MRAQKDILISINNLRKSFDNNIACDNISIDIHRGQILCLTGLNGSGKTTLLNILSGDLKQDSGKIFYLQKEISNIPTYKRHRIGISRAYQWPQLFLNWTVIETIEFGLSLGRAKNDRELKDRLISNFSLEEVLHKKVQSITTSKKKILDLSLSFIGKPKLLLLDEPCAGINKELYSMVAKAIIWARENWKSSVILVDHNKEFLEIIRMADDVMNIYMSDGKLNSLNS